MVIVVNSTYDSGLGSFGCRNMQHSRHERVMGTRLQPKDICLKQHEVMRKRIMSCDRAIVILLTTIVCVTYRILFPCIKQRVLDRLTAEVPS
jgi:hypothetical protein